MTLAIRVQGAVVRREGHLVLDRIDFSVREGEFVALIGPNGGGKSTLLRTVLGLQPVESGNLEVLGAAPRAGRPGIGYVPQYFNADPDFPMPAGEVIHMGLAWASRAARLRGQDRAAALIRRLDLGHLTQRRFGRLSGGEQRRVLIARALVLDPALVLLDEPTAGVDPGHIEPIYELLAEGGRTVVLATHDLSVVATHVASVGCVNRTLVQHETQQVDAELLRELYGTGVEPILHGPVRLLADHEAGHGHAHFHHQHHHGQDAACGHVHPSAPAAAEQDGPAADDSDDTGAAQ